MTTASSGLTSCVLHAGQTRSDSFDFASPSSDSEQGTQKMWLQVVTTARSLSFVRHESELHLREVSIGAS